jgi:hypothetical protein
MNEEHCVFYELAANPKRWRKVCERLHDCSEPEKPKTIMVHEAQVVRPKGGRGCRG